MAINQAPEEEAVFQDPSQGYQAIPTGDYVLKVKALKGCPPGQFGPMIEWVFNIAHADSSTPIYDQDGKPAELRQRTGTALTPKAKARKWMEAFLDRDVDGERGPALSKEVVGRKANASIGPNDNGYSTIMRIWPLKNGKAAAPKSTAQELLEDDLPKANDSEDF